MKNIITVFFLVFYTVSYSQDFECGQDLIPVNKSAGFCTHCCQDYLDINKNDTPIKYISVNFIVIQKSDGTGNFQNNSTDKNWISSTLLNTINYRLGNTCVMNLSTSSPYISDTRIRFVLNDIYFEQDTYYWTYRHGIGSWGNALYSSYSHDSSSTLNIFLVGASNKNLTQGFANGIGSGNYCVAAHIYEMYLNNNHWSPANLIRHELCHNLGLYHSWSFDYCDDTPIHSNCWNGSTCSNNMIDYNASICALTQQQIHRIHYHMLSEASLQKSWSNQNIDLTSATIQGPDVVCSNSQIEFSMLKHQLGTTVNWSVSPSNKFNVSTGCGTHATIICTDNSSGTGQISFTINAGDFGTYTVTKSFTWESAPSPDVTEFVFRNGTGDEGYFCTDRTGNEVELPFCDYDYEIKLTDIDETETIDQFFPYSNIADMDYSQLYPDYYLFWVRGIDECGAGDWYITEIEYTDCSLMQEMYYLEIVPNPTSIETTVELKRKDKKEIIDILEWDLEVYDHGQKLKTKTKKLKDKKYKLNIQGWQEGTYVIRARVKDDIITGKLVVIK